ncbi:MAG: hypothetical protein A3F68_01805 [Acidobacteria bacterium RIFCSPLOWO2_12_FULL_54_10]|nr:MAG: hypothetical protein A3F68_01805 [Acidobacteria bacterium RIFCSPLOWO2_12_FULL_54_10]
MRMMNTSTAEMMDQKEWLSWLIRVRAVIITFLLGLQLTIQQVVQLQDLQAVQVPMDFFLAVMVFWYLLDLIFLILLKVNADHNLQSYLQIVTDTLMVSLVIYFTGGLDSYYFFLYPLTILLGSMILSRGWTYLIASLCFIQSGLLLELPYYRLIPFYGPSFPDLKSLQLRIAANLAAFLAVAYLGSLLAEILRRTGVELKDKAGKLEDLQALNKDIIESMRGGLITTDLQGSILLLNSAGAEILGCELGELQGRQIDSIFPTVNPGSRPDISIVREEITWDRHGGEEKHLGISVAALSRNQETVGYVYNFQDLTQLKQLEREVQLKDRMAAIGRMAAAIAHEIRNPLASIAGSVKLFSNMASLNPDEDRLIQIVLKESERLNGIITDFLLYSREKSYQYVTGNVAEVLSETLALIENHPRFLRGQHHIVTQYLAQNAAARFDPDRMRQVFWNLGDNALKAMPKGGMLTVTVRLSQQYGRLEILFQDSGVGLSPQRAEKIFEPFQSDFEGGTGLGLAIAYQIISAHNGSIRAEPENQGCTMCIELPLVGMAPDREISAAAIHG